MVLYTNVGQVAFPPTHRRIRYHWLVLIWALLRLGCPRWYLSPCGPADEYSSGSLRSGPLSVQTLDMSCPRLTQVGLLSGIVLPPDVRAETGGENGGLENGGLELLGLFNTGPAAT